MTENTEYQTAGPEASDTPPLPEAPEVAAAAPPKEKKRRGPKPGARRKAVAAGPKVLRVKAGTPYIIYIHTQDITVRPGEEPKVQLDSFVQAQLNAKTLVEVE